MSSKHPQFTDAIPANYAKYLVPVLFEPYAESISDRVAELRPSSVLELACGTGVVTRRLAKKLPPSTRLVATDFSEAMLECARSGSADDREIEWRTADACALPFEDATFDVIVSQFGAMFFPDKPLAMAEAFRVLKPGGCLMFSTWGPPELNPLFNTVEITLRGLLPEEETPIMPTVFLMSDPQAIYDLVKEAGFREVHVEEQTFEVVPHSAADIASGFAYGTPLGLYLSGQGHDLNRIHQALTAAYVEKLGDPVHCRMQANVCHATKA